MDLNFDEFSLSCASMYDWQICNICYVWHLLSAICYWQMCNICYYWGKQSLSLFVPVYGLAGNRIFGPIMADTNGDLVEKVGHFEPDFHGF